MIKVVKPPAARVYKPEIGDTDVFGSHEYLVPFHKAKPPRHTGELGLYNSPFIMLSAISPNPFKALERLKIDADALEESGRYLCPYTDWMFNAAVPVAVLSDDVEKYRKNGKLDAFEQAFNHNWNKHRDPFSLGETNRVAQVMMGSGYTKHTLESDGSNSPVLVCVPLSNGDHLATWAWEWYNK